MPFRLREDARKWFAEIEGRPPVKTQFDLFYFCLLAGLTSGRHSNPTHGGRAAPEFLPPSGTFIEDYRPAQRLIIGLLIVAELQRLGINLEEKVSVRKTIQTLVDPQSPTNLTVEGLRMLNAYASGGYDYISEMRGSKPYTVEEFLRDFVGLVGKAATDNPGWAAQA